MKLALSIACVLAAVLALAPDCSARKWEVSLMAGYTMGGGFDQEGDAEGDDVSLGIRESPSFAVAVDTVYEKGTEFEIYYSRQSTELEIEEGAFSGQNLFDLDIHTLQIGGTVILTQATDVFGETLFKPNAFCEPYFVGTVGVAHFRPGDSGYDPETRFCASLGFGTRLHVTERFGFRLEARGIAAFFNGGGAVFSGPEGLKIAVDSEAVGQGVVNAGLYYGF
ncbi:MAG TPA: hypothetical protein PK545_01560 [Deltaproteobacteria bacterium]|nr:hypothetical protein [Deltaproteobacteria bacterium]